MQIRAKLKICSSLLLVPRVPCWGIFKWLSSSEAKEERGDRWIHAFLQRFLRTVLAETPSAHPRCSGEVSFHDLLLLKTFLLAPDSAGTFLWGLICTVAFKRDISHITGSKKIQACSPKKQSFCSTTECKSIGFNKEMSTSIGTSCQMKPTLPKK